MPALPPITFPTIPPQVLTLVVALIGLVLVVGFITGCYYIADGIRSFSSARGKKEKREEALDTARDGAIGAGLCVAGGAILTAVIALIRP